MSDISKEQAIKIAKEYVYPDKQLPSTLISVDAHMYKDRGVWSVGFEYDSDIDPSMLFVDVDIDSGEPKYFYNI